jgi:quercetin dioxygenase-like cupin family protein
MDIFKSGTRPTRKAPAEYFTGDVSQDPIIEAPAPARVRSTRVTFQPGARTHWHTHPFGQTLYVVFGCGRVQSLGGPVREIKAGDVVWFAPGEKHWHGAGPATAMAHVAIQEAKDGSAADWMEPVTDEQYGVKVEG